MPSENEARKRRVREVLRRQAHVALETIARGFWNCRDNAEHGLTIAPALPSQTELDQLREISLIVLFRLLVVSKAEAENRGKANFGLFDPEKHPRLALWKLPDSALLDVRDLVPGAEIDVRDLGDIYEGLLEQRLVAIASDPPNLQLRNQKGERKASGSYFTPDALVDHLVRRALLPLLEACGNDASKVLEIRVLDPAMGTGHFLVKAVDVMADYLEVHCGPADWKRAVVENCIFGVDSDPMAVELAGVSLWLHTGAAGHHLRVGNSLVGASLERLATPGLALKVGRSGTAWEPVRDAGETFAAERSRALVLLADLWCLQWFTGPPTQETIQAYCHPDGLYEQVKRICAIAVDSEREAALEPLRGHPLVQRFAGFLHWPLAFPDVARGFDAVIGNPPWDRLRPERRHFYGSWDVANAQGASLERRIHELHDQHPELDASWAKYEDDVGALTNFLKESGIYSWQVVTLDGKKTGGDPDMFRYFVERAFHVLREGGRLAYLVPGTLWQAEGCTGLRRLLLREATTEAIYVFENHRKWAFDIHANFKFTTWIARFEPPPPQHRFPAAFMLRDMRALQGRLPERVVEMSLELAECLSPNTLALLDLHSDADAKLLARLHAAHPALGSSESGWKLDYRRELDMTNDAWRFKSREWMGSRGFLRVVPGECWVAADAGWYREREYLEIEPEVFVHPTEAEASKRCRIVAGATYTALYEGRMVHNFDHAQKRYRSGEGRQAVWDDLGLADKALIPRVFVESRGASTPRVVFCDVTGATNERTMLASLMPVGSLAGNAVPTLSFDRWLDAAAFTAILASFVADWLLRNRVSTHLNLTYLAQLPCPARPLVTDDIATELARMGTRLNCTTPELADAWNEIHPDQPWTYESAERDPWERGLLRARLDAMVAELYGLDTAEYARVLAGFPLLDRDQPPLPGDAFVTDTDGIVERKPRSFITRDLALLTSMQRKGETPPRDLHRFYVENVGIEPEGPLSRFRIGEIRDLSTRVESARRLGSVAYVPNPRRTRSPPSEAAE